MKMRNSVASESKVVWWPHFEIEVSFSPPKIVRGKITDQSRPLFCDLNLDCEFHHNNLYPKHKTSRSIRKQSNLVTGVVLRNKGKVRSDLWSTTSPSVRPSSSWFIYIWPKLYHFCLPEHIFSSRKIFEADFLWSCFQSKANNTYCRSFPVDLKNEIIFARQNRSGKIR